MKRSGREELLDTLVYGYTGRNPGEGHFEKLLQEFRIRQADQVVGLVTETKGAMKEDMDSAFRKFKADKAKYKELEWELKQLEAMKSPDLDGYTSESRRLVVRDLAGPVMVRGPGGWEPGWTVSAIEPEDIFQREIEGVTHAAIIEFLGSPQGLDD